MDLPPTTEIHVPSFKEIPEDVDDVNHDSCSGYDDVTKFEVYSADFFTEEAEKCYESLQESSNLDEYTYNVKHLESIDIVEFLRKMDLNKATFYPDKYNILVHRIFYAHITPDFGDVNHDLFGRIVLRGKFYDFSPTAINSFFVRYGLAPEWCCPSEKDPDSLMIVGS